MATQKTQGIEELKVFNEKAKEVSQYVEVRVIKFDFGFAKSAGIVKFVGFSNYRFVFLIFFVTLIKDAHGIGKRRDAKTPPTMSQLSVVAYSVIQLLLEPHSATLYYENKKVHPPNLQQVQIKYGLIEGMI